jgi:hypothetical protein
MSDSQMLHGKVRVSQRKDALRRAVERSGSLTVECKVRCSIPPVIRSVCATLKGKIR